jgi:transposase
VRFLRLLLRKVPGKLLVIWDGSPIHRGQAIKGVLARGAAKQIHLERLPGHAPELNPEEGIWNLLTRGELGNGCCHDRAELTCEGRRANERQRQRRAVILAGFAHAACPLSFPRSASETNAAAHAAFVAWGNCFALLCWLSGQRANRH